MHQKYRIYKLHFKQNISYIRIRHNVKYMRAHKKYKHYIQKIYKHNKVHNAKSIFTYIIFVLLFVIFLNQSSICI